MSSVAAGGAPSACSRHAAAIWIQEAPIAAHVFVLPLGAR